MNEKLICREYINGATNKKLSEKYKVHRTTIQRILIRNNIELRKQNKTSRKHIPIAFKEGVRNTKDAYLLGLIFSDGNLSRNCIEISLHEKDKQILSDISNYVYGKEVLSYRKARILSKNNKNYNCAGQYRFRITSKEIVSCLRPLGLKEKKSLTLEYPKINSKFDKDFIRGYFDGDGCISNPYKKRNLQISIVGSHSFCKVLHKKLLEYLNINIKLEQKTDNVSSIRIYGKNQVKIFCDWIYKDANLKINRKYKRYLQI